MRTYFRNTKRPKLIAEALTVVQPHLNHTTALEWVAEVCGYRDWHELNNFTASYTGPETPPRFTIEDLHFGNNLEASNAFESQKKVFRTLIGDKVPMFDSLFESVFHTEDRHLPKAKRIGEAIEGRPMFAGMAFDRFPTVDVSGAEPWGDWDYGEDGAFECFTALAPGLDEEKLTSRFLSRLRKKRGNLYAQGAEHALKFTAPMQTTQAVVVNEEGKRALQNRAFKLLILDEATEELCGVVVIYCEISVPESTGAALAIQVTHAFFDRDTEYVQYAAGGSITAFLSHPIELLSWSRTGPTDGDFSIFVQGAKGAGDENEMAEGIADLLDGHLDLFEDAPECTIDFEEDAQSVLG
jgi:hypothetical protein